MSPPVLGWDQTLFKNPEVFESAYLPESFCFRDEQMKELAFHLSPVLRGGRPFSAVLQGLPGTGKTTAVKKIFSQAEQSVPQLLPVMVNCQIDYTRYAVFSRIHEKLFDHLPRGTGGSFHDLLDTVARTLTGRGLTLAVCLDDANVLLDEGTLNDTLCLITRMHETFPGVRTGVWVVLSGRAAGLDFTRVLRPDVRSIMQPSQIYFPPYDEDELRSILADRVRQGLYPGVLPPPVLDRAVHKTLAAGSDLRAGLSLLKQAALAAEADARMEVREEDVAAAYAASPGPGLDAVVAGLSAEERRVLSSIAKLQVKERKPLSSGPVHCQLCEEKKISGRAFARALDRLAGLRVIDLHACRREGRESGDRIISLRYDPLRVREACGLR